MVQLGAVVKSEFVGIQISAFSEFLTSGLRRFAVCNYLTFYQIFPIHVEYTKMTHQTSLPSGLSASRLKMLSEIKKTRNRTELIRLKSKPVRISAFTVVEMNKNSDFKGSSLYVQSICFRVNESLLYNIQ